MPSILRATVCCIMALSCSMQIIKAMVESITVAEEKIISKGIKSIRERVTNVAEHLNKNVDSMGFRDMMIESLLEDKSNVYRLNEYEYHSC